MFQKISFAKSAKSAELDLKAKAALIMQQDELYNTPDAFLESITQKINVSEDEYVVIIFEIMSEELREYYGGRYLVQQWAKKQKIFQAVHNGLPSNFFLTQQRFIYSLQGTDPECQYLYVSNFYQSIFQKVRHPFYNPENPDGIHDVSVYVDPKQVLVVYDSQVMWAQLKIESIISHSASILSINEKDDKKLNLDQLQNEEHRSQNFIIETEARFINVMKHCTNFTVDPDEDFKIHAVANEGFLRKEIHIAVETADKIKIYRIDPIKQGLLQNFEVVETFDFEKQFAEITMSDKLEKITLESYADQENLIVILKKSGQMKVMSESIMRQMIEYANSVKKAQDDESSSEDEEELARIARLKAERQKLCYRLTRPCRKEEPLIPRKKVKINDTSKNQTLSAIRNFFTVQVDKNFFKVNKFFMRRQFLYFQGAQNNNQTQIEIKKINIGALKNTDILTKSSKVQNKLDVAMIQDITHHLNTFNDFLIANTTLIISHQKVLSIYDFLTKQWNHMLPSEAGLAQTSSQTYFGMPDDEIDSLVLNYIFSNSIYDCIIKYRGKFIRRLKYYNTLDRTYFEKGRIFEGQNVLQLQRNVDARNYRQFGDSTIRTLFMIEDTKLNNMQIWVSENGSRITKLVDQIPKEQEWQLVDIPNARSDMLLIYQRTSRTLTIYNIPNCKQCLYPSQLSKYQTNRIEKIDYDPSSKTQYFLFFDKLYFQQDGNLQILSLKSKQQAIETVNFNKTIKEFYMTHHDAVYYKDKNNIFRFAKLNIQLEFNIDKQPTDVMNCRGAFCTKMEYSITTNRIALFTSSFEISIIPLLDRCRLDLMASQDFDQNFVCWKQIENKLIAFKKPNILVTWNTDTGKIVGYHKIEGMDFGNYIRHTEWNGATLLKQLKEAKTEQHKRGESRFEDNNESFDLDDDEAPEKEAAEKAKLQSDPAAHTYCLIEIISPTEVKEHCYFYFEFKPGTYLYVSYPILLVMDEICTKQYLLSGKQQFKTLQMRNTFYEPQMKLGKPIYFSPNFCHRLFIDPQTKNIVINFTLQNKNIYTLPIRKLLMFQIEKTHPMIYFHDDESIVYLTNQGVEKRFKIDKQIANARRKGFCKLTEIANIYYNEKTFTRRFILDPLSFNMQQASQMSKVDILKFRGDILKRNLQLNIYLNNNTEQKVTETPRFYQDKNLNSFSSFIINNYRQEMTFSYLTWKTLANLANKQIRLYDLSNEFIQELCFTVLPDNKNVFHLLSKDFEVLDTFIKYVNNENIEEEFRDDVELSDLLFVPDLEGKTPLHYSLESNNTRVTDRLVNALAVTDFDHHSRFILSIYPKLVAVVPQSMSTYLDARLKQPQWISEYNRGRIEAGDDIDFNMTADQLWHENLDESLQSKLYQPEALEVPLTMQMLDLPHLHKYENDIADEFLEELAETECIEIFSNTSIQAIIELKWPLVKQAIKKFLFYPYLCFILCFLIYTVYTFEEFHGKEVDSLFQKDDDGKLKYSINVGLDDLKNPKFWINQQKTFLKFIVQCFTLYFFLIETRQLFLAGPGKYLSSGWNYLDIIPLVFIMLSMQFEKLGLDESYERPLNAVACFFMWMKFLYFWRIFRQTSKFISMIVAIVSDLKDFLIVFIVTLTAFGNSMYIMSNNNLKIDPDDYEGVDEDKIPKGQFIQNLADSVFFAYRMSLGDFDTSDLGQTHYLLVITMFILSTLFLTIMMLNILIAVISDSYARVESTSLQEMYKNFADLIAENEYLCYHKNLQQHDKMGDYLYIARVDKTDEAEGEAWEGKLDDVETNLVRKTETIERILKEAQRNLINQVNIQTENFMAQFKEANMKNDLRIQQCIRRIETQSKPMDRRNSTNLTAFLPQNQTNQRQSSPEQVERVVQKKQERTSFFGRLKKGAEEAFDKMADEVNTITNQTRKRAVTTASVLKKKGADQAKAEDETIQ